MKKNTPAMRPQGTNKTMLGGLWSASSGGRRFREEAQVRMVLEEVG
jgi:hypothetical protein